MKALADLPYLTANSIPEDERVQVVSLLNERLADAMDLNADAKQAHWNVKGPHFIALHQLFDAIHSAVEGFVDLLAERVVQLGGIAAGTVAVAAATSSLARYPLDIASGAEHSRAMVKALSEFGGLMRRAIDDASGLGDPATADICTEISRGVDKWLWFVEAHGQSRSRLATLTLEANGVMP